MPTRKILWGTNFENELLPGELYNIVTDREPRDGSETVQASSGVEDSWITGYDYTLEAEARFVPDKPGGTVSPLSGPIGWQGFMDWVRAKNTFRFMPDAAVPEFYVDGCYLVEPFRGLGQLGGDVKRRIPFKIRNTNLDFHQALRGLMFEYEPGMDILQPVAATFTRATAASRRGLPGSLFSVIGAHDVAGILRDRHYEGLVKTTLIEPARTRVIANPENFSAWTVTGIVGLSGGQGDPFGGSAAYFLDSNTPVSSDAIFELASFVSNGRKAAMLFVRTFSGSTIGFAVFDATAGVFRQRVDISWSGGDPITAVPTVTNAEGAGNIFTPIPYGNGWWLVAIAADAIVAANTNRLYIYPDRTGSGSACYAFGACAWDQTWPPSYQGSVVGTTRNADLLTWPYTHPRQSLFVYGKVARPRYCDITDVINGFPGVLTLGVQLEVYFTHTGVTRQLVSEVRGTSIRSAIQTLPAGDIEFCAQFRMVTPVTMDTSLDVGSGPSAFSSSTVMGTLGDQVLRLGRSLSNNHELGGGLIKLKVGTRIYDGVTRDTVAKGAAA